MSRPKPSRVTRVEEVSVGKEERKEKILPFANSKLLARPDAKGCSSSEVWRVLDPANTCCGVPGAFRPEGSGPDYAAGVNRGGYEFSGFQTDVLW